MENIELLTTQELEEMIEARISTPKKLARKELELSELREERLKRLRFETEIHPGETL